VMADEVGDIGFEGSDTAMDAALDQLRLCVEIRRDADTAAAAVQLEREIRRVFEISPQVVTLPLGTLAREFEQSIKAARIRDLRNASNGA